MVIWDETGELCFPQRAREKLWWQNPFLIASGTEFARWKPSGSTLTDISNGH